MQCSKCVFRLTLHSFRATTPTPLHPEPLAPLTSQICARAAPYGPRFVSHRLHPSHTFLSFSRSPQLAAPTYHRRLRSRYTRSDHQRARGSAYYITRARSSTVNVLPKLFTKSYRMAIAEFLSDIITSLYAFFACAVVASRRRAGRWSSPPAPRRARAPAASTPHAHDAASFRNPAAPARTDDRRTNDATCGPPEWLTGKLHDGGTRSVRSPLRRPPLLATPIATPLQGGRPERPGLLFLKLLAAHCYC